MAGSDSTIATVYNKPEVGVRKMEATRWLASLITLIVLFAGIYLYSSKSKTIATFGLPVILVVAVSFIYWVKAMAARRRCTPREPLMRAAAQWQKRTLIRTK